jgi:hypothetical protein
MLYRTLKIKSLINHANLQIPFSLPDRNKSQKFVRSPPPPALSFAQKMAMEKLAENLAQ